MPQAKTRKKKKGIPFWVWAAIAGSLLIAAAIGWVAAHFDDPGPAEGSRVTLPVLHASYTAASSVKNTAETGGKTATLPALWMIGTEKDSPEKETTTENLPETVPPRTETQPPEPVTTVPETEPAATVPTTEPPTEPPTTVPPTTAAPTEPPTTAPPPTQPPTQPPTTAPPTVPPTQPTTEPPVTVPPTTVPPTEPPTAESESIPEESTPEETAPVQEGVRVWIGDSRMTGVRMYVTHDPEKDRFIDRIGEGIGWFQLTAIPAL